MKKELLCSVDFVVRFVFFCLKFFFRVFRCVRTLEI